MVLSHRMGRVNVAKLITVRSKVFRRQMGSLTGPTDKAPAITPSRAITETTDAESGFSTEPG